MGCLESRDGTLDHGLSLCSLRHDTSKGPSSYDSLSPHCTRLAAFCIVQVRELKPGKGDFAQGGQGCVKTPTLGSKILTLLFQHPPLLSPKPPSVQLSNLLPTGLLLEAWSPQWNKGWKGGEAAVGGAAEEPRSQARKGLPVLEESLRFLFSTW